MVGQRARWTAGFLLLGMLLLLGGCAALLPQSVALVEQRPADLPARVELTDVPFFPQEEFQCGPAALAMALNAAGLRVTPDSLVEQVYIPARRGSLQVEMLAAARRHGLIAYELEPRLTDLLREIAAGTPVIVLENHGFRWLPIWHYAVAIGYDLDKGDLIRRSGLRQRQVMPIPVFEFLWKDDGHWAMVAVPPDRVPATATEPRYASAVVALEKRGEVRNAHTAYNALLKRWPASLGGLMGRGNTAYALGDLTTAESAFRGAVESHPDSAAALNNLAQVLADRGKLDEALATAERAVSLGGPLLPVMRGTLEGIRNKARAGSR